MPGKGAKRLINHALALHEGCLPLLVKNAKLKPGDVHHLLVSVKELRALWQVLKPFLAKGVADDASRNIHLAAKQLAGARDQHVQLKTLNRCMKKANEKQLPAFWLALQLLSGQHPVNTQETQLMSDVVDRFMRDRERWRALEITCSSSELLADGYGGLYRKARKRFRQAAASGQPKDWHRLRRWTKYLGLVLPTLASGEKAQTAAADYAALAKKLGNLHDLDLLEENLKVLNEQQASPLQPAIEVVAQRADKLRRQCERTSSQLFSHRHDVMGKQ